ncbi:MAG: 9-O-acetylesterase [Pedobacter sp.]|nr:MAG: 9-O-acetylesterase [Pedobacter sp.]
MKAFKGGALVAALFFVNDAQAKVKLPSIFSDNMVFQQKSAARIWGTSMPGKTVKVNASWSKLAQSVVAGKDGKFIVTVPTPAFGGPYTVTINDGDETILKNILLGEVWVCSGQSNMEMPVKGWGKVLNYEQEIKDANYPKIRLLQGDHVTSDTLLNEAKVWAGGWKECTSKNIPEFSAVAYSFAREIFKKTGIPVGLIHTSWGGTIAEAWTSGTTLKTMPDFADAVNKMEDAAKGNTSLPSYQQQFAIWQEKSFAVDASAKDGGWQAANLDVSSWKSIKLPAAWEDNGLPNIDGIVWLRKTIDITKSLADKELKLNLGVIDDNDVTYVNGVKVGETIGYGNVRQYTIPASQVKEGLLVIAVRVTDTGGGGGIYGGSNVITITSASGETINLAGEWKYKLGVELKDLPPLPKTNDGPNRVTVLYNAMINPYLNFPIKGAIWYQGESNADRANQYRTLFPAMIQDWRKSWKQPDFPFYFVQLANFMKTEDQPVASPWAELRDAQKQTLSLLNTGMAVAIDIGDAVDIHPKNKQEVGRRLALIALAKNYGIKIPFSGPVYQSQQIAGKNSIQLSFTSAEGGLKTKDGAELKGFAIAGADKKFYWATAKIEGNKIIVSSPDVNDPIAVRYAWANNPVCNLVNGAGLPASPFRTDQWADTTLGKK